MTTKIVTIGVYGFDETSFFEKLCQTQVDLFCDIRARRGVRGAAYAFANSQRLQARLAELGIEYVHRPELAPSKELRQRQYATDNTTGTAKRQRTTLSPDFIHVYEQECLTAFDSVEFLAELGTHHSVIALHCVEKGHEACHRGLVANRLQKDLTLEVVHITPD